MGLGGKIRVAQGTGRRGVFAQTRRNQRRHRNARCFLYYARRGQTRSARETAPRSARSDRKNSTRTGTHALAASLDRQAQEENVHSRISLLSAAAAVARHQMLIGITLGDVT